LPRNDPDRVLWTLTEHGGSMTKSDLARRLQIRQAELDVVLQELERAGKIKLTEIKGKLVVGLRDAIS
jgi:Mn-dependent DtxR family transcriptional regulator